MTLPKKIYILAGIFLLSSIPLSAQYDGEEINHLIVSIDTKPGSSYGDSVAYGLIGVVNSHKILKKGDYISVLQYSVPERDPRLDKYVRIPRGEGVGKHIFERVKSGSSFRTLFTPDNLRKFAQSPYRDLGYSLSSIAKPYSIAALTADSILVNRTFIALVTDHHYNASDFYQELDAWRNARKGASLDGRLSFNDIMEKCYVVEKEYFMRYIDTREIRGGRSCWYVDLYEFVPLRKDVSFASVFYYPPTLKAVRVKGKGYRIDLPLKNTIPGKFKAKRVDIVSRDSDGNPCDSCSFSGKDEFEYTTFAAKRGGIGCLDAVAWLNLVDGFYNATLLTPDEHCSPGLNTGIQIEYPEDAKVFGMPLSDGFWFFFPDDQYMAALVWKAIIWALAVLLIAFCLKLLGRYRPGNRHIHLE